MKTLCFVMAFVALTATAQTPPILTDIEKIIQSLQNQTDQVSRDLLVNLQTIQQILTAIATNASAITAAQIQNLTAALNATQSTITKLANTTLSEAQRTLLASLNATLGGVTGFVTTALQGANNFGDAIAVAVGALGNAATGVISAVRSVLDQVNEEARRSLQDTLRALQDIARIAGNMTAAGAKDVAAAANNLIAIIGPLVNGTAEVSTEVAKQIADGMKALTGAIERSSLEVQKAVKGAAQTVFSLSTSFVEALGQLMRNTTDMAEDTITDALGMITRTFDAFGTLIQELLRRFTNMLCRWFTPFCGIFGR